MAEQVLSALESARARQHAFYWLGRLLREGLTPETAAVARQIPELARHLPAALDEDAAGADYQALFGFSLFPYEGVFLDPTAQLGGPATDGVLRTYARLGYRPPTTTLSGDHIGCQLDLLAFLSAAEADALADGLDAEAARMEEAVRAVLDDHVLRWLPPLHAALRRQSQSFYQALGDLVTAVLLDRRAALAAPPQRRALPAPPDLLGDEKARLRDVAAYVLTPVYSGLFVSRDEITSLARDLRLPRGFGSREQMLLNLLRAAGQYDGVDRLMTRLLDHIDQHRSVYAAQAAAWPLQQSVWRPWETRAGITISMLEGMRAQVAGLAALDDA